jgi:hypothetical protein
MLFHSTLLFPKKIAPESCILATHTPLKHKDNPKNIHQHTDNINTFIQAAKKHTKLLRIRHN